MKVWIGILTALFASSTFAQGASPLHPELCLGREAITADATFVELDMMGNFARFLIPTPRARQWVVNSEKVSQGTAAPFCEKVTAPAEGLGEPDSVAEYTACYTSQTIDLQFFGSLANLSLCTSELAFVLNSVAGAKN